MFVTLKGLYTVRVCVSTPLSLCARTATRFQTALPPCQALECLLLSSLLVKRFGKIPVAVFSDSDASKNRAHLFFLGVKRIRILIIRIQEVVGLEAFCPSDDALLLTNNTNGIV